jgi:hypothetical protein
MKIVQIIIFLFLIIDVDAQSDSLRKAQKRLFGEQRAVHSLDSFLNVKTPPHQIIGAWLLDTVNSKKTTVDMKVKTIKSLHSKHKVQEFALSENKRVILSAYEDEIFYWSVNKDTLIWWQQKAKSKIKRDAAMLIHKLSENEMTLTTPIGNATLIFRRKNKRGQ